VRIDGVELDDVDTNKWRRQISVVSQDVRLFDRTILDNIAFRPPAEGEPVKRGVALVSTSRLENEEILLDYKLQRDGPLEPWYVPYVPAAAEISAGAEDSEGAYAALKRSEPELPPFA